MMEEAVQLSRAAIEAAEARAEDDPVAEPEAEADSLADCIEDRPERGDAPEAAPEARADLEAASDRPTLLERVRRRVGDRIDPTRRRDLEQTQEELRSAERELEVDPLTGLGSPRALSQAQAAAEVDPEVEIVAIDLGNLKAVNEHEGHEAGDEMLRRAGEAIASASSRGFRRSGDEFVVLAPAGEGQAALERAQEAFGAHEAGGFPVTLDGAVAQTYSEADAAVTARKAGREEGRAFRAVDVSGPEVFTDAMEGAEVQRGQAARATPPEQAQAYDDGPIRARGVDFLNNATVDELQQLPGVGPRMADRIVERREGEPLASVDDLADLPGLSARRRAEVGEAAEARSAAGEEEAARTDAVRPVIHLNRTRRTGSWTARTGMSLRR